MRAPLLMLVILAACSPTRTQVKLFHPVTISKEQGDVVWVLRDDKLFRCAVEEGYPVCARARYKIIGSGFLAEPGL